MRLSALYSLIGIILTSTLNLGHAEVWQGPFTQKEKSHILGVYGQLIHSPGTEFMVNGNWTYGLTNRLQIEPRIALGTLDPLVGLYSKFALFNHPFISISPWGGVFYHYNLGIEAALIMGHSFGSLEIYGAPDFKFIFSDPTVAAFALTFGFDFFVTQRMRFYAEYLIGLSKSSNSASAGVRFTL